MKISELANLSANVSVCITLSDLKEFVSEMVAEVAAKPQQTEERLLSADEVCKALGISANSLWRWGKTGYLRGSKVGRKTFYNKNDVDALLRGKGA